MVHHIKNCKSKFGVLALKVDLGKTYDRLRWGFLQETLKLFGFLIMWGVTGSNLAILWNGSKLDNFSRAHGLRQRGFPFPLPVCSLHGEVGFKDQ